MIVMTDYLYNIERLMGTFDAIVRNDGKNIAGIVKAEDASCLRGRINELIDKKLAKQYRFGYREIHLTRKGYEVMELLRQVQERLGDDDGSDEEHVIQNKEVE